MTVHAPAHDHHDHGHGHDHHGHGHAHASPDDPRYGLAIALNVAIVAAQGIAGVLAHSTALVADAGHNLSDVLGLVLAGGALWLARRPAAGRRTYGFGKATVLAALANGVVLMLVSGAILLEAVERLIHPQPINTGLVMIVAGFGVVANGITALMFLGDRKGDLNARGVFLHMAADAGLSLGVIASAGAIALTGWTWLDPLVSLAIIGVIVTATWNLLREATALAMDAAPEGVDLPSIEAFLRGGDGVADVHDLHVWAMSTSEVALTAHVVRPGHDGADRFRDEMVHALENRFGVRHATLQIEQTRDEHCPEC